MTGAPHPDADPHLTTALTPAWPERAAWGTAPSLRAWQTAALKDYLERTPRDYLAVATPGAGKTTFALSVAAELIGRRVIDRVTVVAPTEHLKLQWAEAAARAGIPIDPTYSAGKGKIASDFLGVAVTYAGVAVNPLALRIRTERFKTLVILDEVHHAGDALSWGEGVREAFEPAARRLALTGTPFRSDVNPIPFVTYAPGDDGVPRSVADYTYGYGHALADHVVRPVLFLAYSGEMSWRTRAGDEVAARLGEPLTKDLTNQALRTALDPSGSWIPTVLAAADNYDKTSASASSNDWLPPTTVSPRSSKRSSDTCPLYGLPIATSRPFGGRCNASKQNSPQNAEPMPRQQRCWQRTTQRMWCHLDEQADATAGLASRGDRKVRGSTAAGLPRNRDARSGKDNLRFDARRQAQSVSNDRPHHRGRAD